MGNSRPLFLYFGLLDLQWVGKILQLVGFEPQISGVRRDRSTKLSHNHCQLLICFKEDKSSLRLVDIQLHVLQFYTCKEHSRVVSYFAILSILVHGNL